MRGILFPLLLLAFVLVPAARGQEKKEEKRVEMDQATKAATAKALGFLKTRQNADGSWGFYGQPTPEETAYGLLALLTNRELDEHDRVRCQAAADFLEAAVRNNVPNPPLWIDKCLYIPPLVVNAAIEAALTAWNLRNNTMKRS